VLQDGLPGPGRHTGRPVGMPVEHAAAVHDA